MEKTAQQYRKKPVVVEAVQWFQNGDHPEDDCKHIGSDEAGGNHPQLYLSEGKVVRYFRRPDIEGQQPCRYCSRIMHDHGWIDTLEGGHIVCPGDWVIAGVNGERYPCKPNVFEKTYEPASLSSLPSDSEKAARERSRIRAMDFLRWYEHSDYRSTPKTVSELYIIFNTLNPE